MKTKELIFDKALELFALHGYDATSVRNICKAVGLSESSLYNHYKGKEDLLSAILERCNEVFERENPTTAEREHLADTLSLRQMLVYMLDRYIASWEDPKNLQIWQVVSNEQYKNKEAGMIIIRETARRIERATAIFDQMQRNNKMIPCDSHRVATDYVYSIRSQHLTYFLGKLYQPENKRFIVGIYQTASLLADLYEIK